MAANRVNFAESMRPFLVRGKTECLSSVETGEGVRRVNSFFSELENAVDVLDDKYAQPSRLADVQRLLDSRGIVGRSLRKLHKKIVRRLQSKPKIANPWMGELAIDMPRELFSCMASIIDRTNFGHRRRENNTTIIYDIVDIRKAKYLFMRMDLDGVQDVDRNAILKKQKKTGDVNPSERCEVVVSQGKPMKLKFHKSSEVLTLSFHYGYWNCRGVSQH